MGKFSLWGDRKRDDILGKLIYVLGMARYKGFGPDMTKTAPDCVKCVRDLMRSVIAKTLG
jgi:hypothetical protein